MKTSNKLIWAFVLVCFLASAAIHGVLYSEYRQGHFVTAEQMHAEGFVKVALPAPTPRVLSFESTIWVNLIPAGSFALDLPRINKDPCAGLFETAPGVTLLQPPNDHSH